MHHQAVLDAIDADGCRTADFREAWSLEHDPHAILLELQERLAAARQALTAELENEPVKRCRGGFLWLFKRWRWRGEKYKSPDIPELVRRQMLAVVSRFAIGGDDYSEAATKKRAMKELGLAQAR